MPTTLVDSRVNPRFAGICTFCRWPRLVDVVAEHRPVDWVAYGVPFDGGVTYRPGARFGPRAIREASQYVKPFHLEFGVNVAERLSLADGGDAPVKPFDVRDTAEAVAAFAKGLGDPSSRLLAVGGDHSIAYANIKATWERQGRPAGGLSLIHLDSHLDTVDVIWGEKWSHGSVFRRCIEDGLIDPKRMISIGVKGPLNTGADLDYAKSVGVTVITYEQMFREGQQTFTHFLKHRVEDQHPVYLTFDIDVVDPAFAPGTGTPSVGGFTSAEVLALLRRCRGVRLVGADIVEVLPDRDPAGITSLLAAHVLFELVALTA
ncbi:MAG: agmatinase [Phycisphaerales bacterium]|jgi:agmatinase